MKTLTAAAYEARLIHLGENEARQIVTEFEQLENDGVSTIVDLDSLWLVSILLPFPMDTPLGTVFSSAKIDALLPALQSLAGIAAPADSFRLEIRRS